MDVNIAPPSRTSARAASEIRAGVSDSQSLFLEFGVAFDGTDESVAMNLALEAAKARGLTIVDCGGRTIKVVAQPIFHPGGLTLRNLVIDYGEVKVDRGRYYGLGAHGRLGERVPLARYAPYQGHDLLVSSQGAIYDPSTRDLTIGASTFSLLDHVKIGTAPPLMTLGSISEASTFIPLTPPEEVARMKPYGEILIKDTKERIAYFGKEPDNSGVHVRTLGGVSGRGYMGTRVRAHSGGCVGEHDSGRFQLGHDELFRKAEWGQISQIEPCGAAYFRITLSTSLVERAGYAPGEGAWIAKHSRAITDCNVDGVILIGSEGHRTPARTAEVGAYFAFCEGREHRIESRRAGGRSLEYNDCLNIKVVPRVTGKSEGRHDGDYGYVGISIWNACQWMSVDLSLVKDTFAAVTLQPVAANRQHDSSGQPTHIQVVGGQFFNASSLHVDAHPGWEIDGGARHVTYIGCSAANAASGITFRSADSVTVIGARLTGMNDRGVSILDQCCLFDLKMDVEVGPRSHRGGTTVLSRALGTGVAITAISNSRPAIVTVADGAKLMNGETVSISGVEGMTRVSGLYTVTNLSGNAFELYSAPFRGKPQPVNTRGFRSYVSGGMVNLAEIPVENASGLVDEPNRSVARLMVRIGEEILAFHSVDTGFSKLLRVERGQHGTAIVPHEAGDLVVPFGRSGYRVFSVDLRKCKLYRRTADAPMTYIWCPSSIGHTDHVTAAATTIPLDDGSVFGVPDGTVLTLELEGEDAGRWFESEIVTGTLQGNALVNVLRGQLGTTASVHHEFGFVLRYAPSVSNVAIDIAGEMDHDGVAGLVRGYTPAHNMNIRARLKYVGEGHPTSPAIQLQPHLATLRGEWENYPEGVMMQGRRQLVTDFRARVYPPSSTGQAVKLAGSDSTVIGGLAEGYAAAGIKVYDGMTGCRVAGGFTAPDARLSVEGPASTGDVYPPVPST